MSAERPCTPPMMSALPNLKLHDSPFSDYCTDSSFSPGPAPSKVQRGLLDRLTHIAGQILRDEPDAAVVRTLEDELDAVYAILTAPDSQTRQPADLVDSGLFIDDDDALSLSERLQETGLQLREVTGNQVDESEKDELLAEQQDVLERMTKLSAQLRQRFMETKDNCSLLMVKLENATSRLDSLRSDNETLRSDNESLRSDLLFDYSELLFLKLQLKTLEVQSAPHKYKNSTGTLVENIEHWKEDWRLFDERFRDRKKKYESVELHELLEEGELLAAELAQSLKKDTMNVDSTLAESSFMTTLPTIPGNEVSDHERDQLHERTHTDTEADQTESTIDTLSRHAISENGTSLPNEHTGRSENPQESPTHTTTRAGLLARFWSSQPKHNPEREPRLDTISRVWDALADATGVGMYDDFYDEYWRTD